VSGVARGRDPVWGGRALEAAASLRGPVKTNALDAIHLARLLRLDEVTPVVVPSVDEEAAREDCRGDLMRAWHRLSRLLLRHGVYSGGRAWTGAHDAWLRRIGREQLTGPATRMTFDSD
jgi:hypothetical protein